MQIHFGLHLDAMIPAPPRTAIGEATVGPQGLLRMLESDLGLAPVLDHPAERLIAYRGCLAAADGPQRFYHRSFQVDPINVTATLASWREQWYEAGWTGAFPAGLPARLTDLADVERLARERVPPCVGQRLARVLDALETRRTQIETLVLHGDPAALPLLWRCVLERIGYQAAPGVHAAAAPPQSDLGRVQARLATLSEGEAPARLELSGDGSFVVVRAASPDVSARAIAEWLRSRPDPDTLLIAEQNGIIVDNAMERSGLPRCGFQHYSRFRAVSQVLKLALGLLWEPLDPHLLLQFLIHPVGPVPAGLRRTLAEAVARQPGVGGAAWTAALERLEERRREKGAGRDAIDAERALVTYWFESPRHDPAAGAPLAVLVERAQRCASWLVGRLAAATEPVERALFAGAHAQAGAFIAALGQLRDQGRERLPRIETERLVDEVTRDQPDPALFAEVGHVRATTHPGNVTRPWRRVIWWDLKAQNQSFGYPWSTSELAALQEAGVALPTTEERLAQRAAEWLQPLFACEAQLVLVVHHGDAGHHPLWTRIASLFDGWAEVDLEQALLAGRDPLLPQLEVDTEPVAVKTLPAPRRWWELPPEVALPPRPVESYSSLSKLFHYPHGWVLGYAARLRTGRAEDVADQWLLYGNLAHRLFETFFREHPDWATLTETAVFRWLQRALPRLVAAEGAVLLERGRGVDHEQVVTTLERALLRLLEHLRAAGVVRVEPERGGRAPFLDGGMEIAGSIDLLLTTGSGREIVLDAKWGGEQYRARDLEQNLHLQLVSYAYLRQCAADGGRWPYQAYFIVTTGNVVAPDDTVFPDALVHAPAEGIDVARLWRAAEATYRWRRAQLDRGLIEVRTDAAEPTERSEPPEGTLPLRDGADRYDEFARLTGWDPFA
ncbi:MAG TPA: PD-(D/E)XK nuclease family protein [Pseudomonadales bacterium]